jgi:hypothetical protein
VLVVSRARGLPACVVVGIVRLCESTATPVASASSMPSQWLRQQLQPLRLTQWCQCATDGFEGGRQRPPFSQSACMGIRTPLQVRLRENLHPYRNLNPSRRPILFLSSFDFPVTGGSALRLLSTLLSLSLSLPPVLVTPAFLTMQPIAIGPANFSLRLSPIHQYRMRTPILLSVASSPLSR